MSIANLRDLNGHNLKGITMRYEQGGMVQVYKYQDREIRFGPMVSDSEVAAAFKDENNGGK